MPSILKATFRGKRVDVGVCWPQERVDALSSSYPDGVVDVEHFVGDSSTEIERAWLVRRVRTLLDAPWAKRDAAKAKEESGAGGADPSPAGGKPAAELEPVAAAEPVAKPERPSKRPGFLNRK